MGHRCNIVVKRAGSVDIYYSHWGALSLLADVLKGPDAYEPWASRCSREPALLDNAFAEAVALADFDAQTLLVFGGVTIRYLLPVRRAYLARIPEHWPGWRIEWADRGTVDVARYLGLPIQGIERRPLRCPADEDLAKPGTGPFTWVTVVGDRVGDFPFRFEPGELVLVGPRLLDWCTTPGVLPPEDHLGGGLLFDPVRRYLGWWSAGGFKPTAPALEATWPGWEIAEMPRGLLDQVAASGRDPAPYAMSDELVRTRLTNELFPQRSPDPIGLLRRFDDKLRREGQGPAEINPNALIYPRPDGPSTK